MPPSSMSAQVASKMPVPDVDKLTLMGVGLVMAMLLLDCWMQPLLSVAHTETVWPGANPVYVVSMVVFSGSIDRK